MAAEQFHNEIKRVSARIAKEEKRRLCSHNNVPGYCVDCGSPVYIMGSELYHQRFQDVYNLGACKLFLDFEKVKTIEEFKAIREKMYPKIRQLVDEYGMNVDAIVDDLRTGKGAYK